MNTVPAHDAMPLWTAVTSPPSGCTGRWGATGRLLVGLGEAFLGETFLRTDGETLLARFATRGEITGTAWESLLLRLKGISWFGSRGGGESGLPSTEYLRICCRFLRGWPFGPTITPVASEGWRNFGLHILQMQEISQKMYDNNGSEWDSNCFHQVPEQFW